MFKLLFLGVYHTHFLIFFNQN
uniref:Uncharacterized protein n=1 Tax=Rhizophora mucronata TaxID=61149 RepID=A0A2P2NUV7_RHIMU